MRVLRFLSPIGLVAAAFILDFAAPASAAPGDEQYTILENHDPAAFQRALRAGSDFVKGGRGRKFNLILANRGVISVIPGTTTVQRDIGRLRAPGLAIIACAETMRGLSEANRRRVPVVPGVTVRPCKGLRNKLDVSGWQRAPGI
ncbi:hypothetical protein JOD31_000314 [Methylopila capsulata]|uniref:DsrE/DsrF-like family protein n=1 Tax=Methylopila capsulata TaxID=61654 RepID=A0ABS2T5L1_9HYPH|nr:hypothetical protein [Methylopila capsulata]MBM7850102.1 hypothetical protein [Methylopila capsulata]